MERDFDRDTYLNKEKYDAAVAEENKKKDELISRRIEDIQKCREYEERQWRYLKRFIKAEIQIAIAKNDGASDEGLELLNGLSEECFSKFLVAYGVRNVPGITDESKAILQLKSEGLI